MLNVLEYLYEVAQYAQFYFHIFLFMTCIIIPTDSSIEKQEKLLDFD